MSTELNISGMTCGHCVTAVSKALKSVPGVRDARVDLNTGTAVVEGQADVERLISAVVAEGYTAGVQQ